MCCITQHLYDLHMLIGQHLSDRVGEARLCPEQVLLLLAETLPVSGASSVRSGTTKAMA